MEIVLASTIGLAVACVVFVVGRTFIGSRSISEQAPQPDSSLFANASPHEADETVQNLDHVTAHPAEPVSQPLEITPPRKARKPSTALSQVAVKAPRSRRTRKARKTTVPGTDAVQ
jgi:hypothetical protein